MMTPKEAYEARKAERAERRRTADFRHTSADVREAEYLEFLDRFVTAFERIADAMETNTVPYSERDERSAGD